MDSTTSERETADRHSSLPLPPPPTQEESTVSQPKEPLVEKPASPPLPTVSKPTQVNESLV